VGSAPSRELTAAAQRATLVARGADLGGYAQSRDSLFRVQNDNPHVATVVPAEGVVLKRVLEAAHAIASEGLSREAYRKFDAAQMKTEWVAITADDSRSWMVPTCLPAPCSTTLRRSSINDPCACAESARSSPRPHVARAAMRESSWIKCSM
jgi:hypothetical protein